MFCLLSRAQEANAALPSSSYKSLICSWQSVIEQESFSVHWLMCTSMGWHPHPEK
jgi:hypothetical protein